MNEDIIKMLIKDGVNFNHDFTPYKYNVCKALLKEHNIDVSYDELTKTINDYKNYTRKNMKTVEELFGYDTKESELIEFFNNIKDTFKKPDYTSIPKLYYPYLYKLLSYRKYDVRGTLKEDDVKTFFVAKDSYSNNSIALYDKDGNFYFLGTSNAVKEWSKEKTNQWDNMLKDILQVCRNIARYEIKKKQETITFPCKCEITGEIIENKEDMHIDHYNKDFAEVVYDWLYLMKKQYEKTHNGKWCDIVNLIHKYIKYGENLFTYNKLNRSFYDYHNEHTHLRITKKKANLSKEKSRPNWEYLKLNGYYLEKYAKEKYEKTTSV